MAKPASSDGAEPDGCGPAAAPALVALRCLVALVLLMASGGVINGTIYASMASFSPWGERSPPALTRLRSFFWPW